MQHKKQNNRRSVLLSLAVTAALLLPSAQLTAQTYSGGSGTENAPYLISSKADMVALANAVNNGTDYSADKYFLLTRNLTGITTTIGNVLNNNSKAFQGIFDGGGYVIGISNTCIFGKTAGAVIKNLGTNGSLGVISYSYTIYGGGLCAYASNTTFTNCFNKATISITRNDQGSLHLGGICGIAEGSTIINCYNEGAISGTTNCGSSGCGTICYVGGICGIGCGASINNNYNKGSVSSQASNGVFGSSTACSGGICGNSEANSINKCYNMGNIFSNNYAGGIIGNADFTSSVANCFNASMQIVSGLSGRRIIGAGNAPISDCHSLSTTQVNGVAVSSTDAASKDGKDEDAVSFQLQAWLTENLAWDFTNSWYMPPSGYPLLKNKPSISMAAQSMSYGETVNFASNNPSRTVSLSCAKQDSAFVSIEGSSVTVFKTGTITITATQVGVNEWAPVATEYRLVVGKKAVAVTVNDSVMAYGNQLPKFTCRYEGFVNGDTEDVLTTLPTYACNATSTSNVGSYIVVPSGAAAQNYSFTYQNGTLSVTKRPLSVTPNNAKRTYGSANPTFTLAYSGFVNGETASAITTPPTASATANANNTAGSYDIRCSGGSAANYSFTYNTGTLTVIKAPLSITANNAVRSVGQANPIFTLSFAGLKNGESYSALDELPVASCTANAGTEAGSYAINLSGGNDRNYSYTLANGTLTVTATPPPTDTVYIYDTIRLTNTVYVHDTIYIYTNTPKPTAVSATAQAAVKLYPNPVANGQLTVDYEQWKEGEVAETYSTSGALVSTYNITSKKTSLNVSPLPNGAYFLKVGKYTAKFVKQ